MRFTLSIALMLACCFSCTEPAMPDNDASHGVILQYHHVSDETPPITSISPAQFEAHLAWLASNAFEVWPLERLVDTVRVGKPTPDRVVAITFDDAYRSIYTTALPLLRRHGWPFTIFVSTEFVGANPDQYLSWDELKEMKAAGATIANHTHSHTHLLRRLDGESAEQWRARITADIARAQDLIRKHLGDAPALFAYPYGEYDGAVIEILESLGYTAFGQQSGAFGPAARFTLLPRFPMGGNYSGLESFATKMQTLPLPIEAVLTEPLVDGDTTPALELTFTREGLRFHQLACYGPDGNPTPLMRTSGTTFVAQSEVPVPVGRSRYNCTMPSAEADRYYWFSQLWIRKNPDGSWYPEP